MGRNMRISILVVLIGLGTALSLKASDSTWLRNVRTSTADSSGVDTAKAPPILSTSGVTHLAYCTATHDVGKLSLLMTNGGMIGISHFNPYASYLVQPPSFSPTPYSADSSGCHLGGIPYGSQYYGGEYPAGSGDKCLLDAALWVGAVTESGDTLVSVGLDDPRPDGVSFEMYPDADPFGGIYKASRLDPLSAGQARSDQDFRAVYTDTFVQGLPGLIVDWKTHRHHQPLGISVTQTSSEWSNALVDKFILIEYRIANIGRQKLHDVYAGMYFVPFIGHIQTLNYLPALNNPGQTGGLLRTAPSSEGCGFVDTLDVAWSAGVNGSPMNGKWVESGVNKSDRSIFGVRLLQAPAEAFNPSYNWWQSWWISDPTLDYGPRHRSPIGQRPWDFGTNGGTGSPPGDDDKYYLMSNGEFDPDEPRIYQIQPIDPVWEYPSQVGRDWAIGYGGFGGMHNLLSAGPFNLNPGDEKTVVYAFVAGDTFQQDMNGLGRLASGDIDGWYAHVDFSSLAKSAKIAEWTFDNPGVSTDGSGYKGKFRVCVLDSAFVNGHWVPTNADTTYYTGDGIPDWRAPGPPPQPKFWLSQAYHGIRVRFNGKNSETAKNLFTNLQDFEGYRIYYGLDDRESSLSLVASYDRQDYDKYVWNPKSGSFGAWVIKDVPFTLDRLKCLYGRGTDPCHDSLFDPLRYTQTYPLRLAQFPDSQFYFVPHDYNASIFGKTTQIEKIYPNAVLPPPGVTLDSTYVTPDGYLKYYEYEFTITNLLPTMQDYVNVTAFNWGDPSQGVPPLENSKTLGLQTGYAFADSNQLAGALPPVYIYPNPYFADGRYRSTGFEGRTNDASDDRVRLIHFVNVPSKCTVRILTLDGDLVAEVRHDKAPSDPNAHHETWNMINKNIQTVVSGLYYWAVEGSDGKVQIGKLVIIR